MTLGWLWLLLASILFLAAFLYRRMVSIKLIYLSTSCGIAAAMVALILSVMPLSSLNQSMAFVCALAFSQLILLRRQAPLKALSQGEARIAPQLIGTKASLLSAISEVASGTSRGQVQIQDRIWEVSSHESIQTGQLIEVVGSLGAALLVKPCRA